MMKMGLFFGFLALMVARGTISLVNSALNTEGGGIYVGTDRTTAVPEPTTAGLLLAGALLLLPRRRARDSARSPVRQGLTRMEGQS